MPSNDKTEKVNKRRQPAGYDNMDDLCMLLCPTKANGLRQVHSVIDRSGDNYMDASYDDNYHRRLPSHQGYEL
jgi:hypothetical protein